MADASPYRVMGGAGGLFGKGRSGYIGNAGASVKHSPGCHAGGSHPSGKGRAFIGAEHVIINSYKAWQLGVGGGGSLSIQSCGEVISKKKTKL